MVYAIVTATDGLAYLLIISWQTALFWQGILAHSSTSTSQWMPPNPGRHSQEYIPMRSWQSAPLRQGFDSHSSISVSQLTPGREGGSQAKEINQSDERIISQDVMSRKQSTINYPLRSATINISVPILVFRYPWWLKASGKILKQTNWMRDESNLNA